MKHVELEQFWHAFTSRGFDIVSWAFLFFIGRSYVVVFKLSGSWFCMCNIMNCRNVINISLLAYSAFIVTHCLSLVSNFPVKCFIFVEIKHDVYCVLLVSFLISVLAFF